tara:strand:+ start:917 stop:2041 length:1125 start_codon:yes stop_codon:yes gene_type:complete
MSSVKQEVAAILMDYTDRIPDDVYIGILNQLSNIPDHKDPKKASEIQKELNNTQNKLSILTDRNYALLDDIDYLNKQLDIADKRIDFENHSKCILKQKYSYIYRRMIWLEQMCEEIYEEDNNRLLSECEYSRYGFDIIHKDDETKQSDKILSNLASLFDTGDELEEEEIEKQDEFDSEEFYKNDTEDESFYLDQLFNNLDNIKYGYYKYVSSTWWHESLMSRLTYYLLNGYKVTYYNEWGLFINNCYSNYISSLSNRNDLDNTNTLNNYNNNYDNDVDDNNDYNSDYDNDNDDNDYDDYNNYDNDNDYDYNNENDNYDNDNNDNTNIVRDNSGNNMNSIDRINRLIELISERRYRRQDSVTSFTNTSSNISDIY